MRCRLGLAEQRDAFDDLCGPWIGGGYRIGAGGKRGERSAATARPGADATAVVTFDARAVFRAASSHRTPTADA
jgi:hypothetical protein